MLSAEVGRVMRPVTGRVQLVESIAMCQNVSISTKPGTDHHEVVSAKNMHFKYICDGLVKTPCGFQINALNNGKRNYSLIELINY